MYGAKYRLETCLYKNLKWADDQFKVMAIKRHV